MPDTLTIGPVVRMCEDLDCRGYNDCPAAAADRARNTDKTLAMTGCLPVRSACDEIAVGVLAQEIAAGMSTDSGGARRTIPDGCEFRIHKSATHDGCRIEHPDYEHGVIYTALYSGPETGIDAILAGAEPWPGEDSDAYDRFIWSRLTALRESGVLAAAEAAAAARPA